jgi:hypothetical protein
MPTLEGNDKLQQKYWRDDIERAFWPLQTPLTAAAWDGDMYGTVDKTPIVVPTVFSTPPGVRALLCHVAIMDVGAAGDYCFILSPNNTALSGMFVNCNGSQAWNRECIVVPTDDNGNVYYQVVSSAPGSMSVIWQIWGYWRHAGR